ncbi:MAG: hypothetical protein ACREEM_55040 [Blastocatellia bacterium]
MKQIGIAIALLAMLVVGAYAQDSSSNQNKAGHAIVGEVKKVDHAAGKIVVKTAEGTEETFKFTGKTMVHGLKEGGKVAEEGSHVVIHYTGEGVEKTAVGIEHIGKDAPRFVEGTVVRTGKGVRTVIVKTPAGVEETLHLTERVTVDTGKGVVKGTEYVAKEGEHVTVHYTVVGGRKVAHLVKKI